MSLEDFTRLYLHDEAKKRPRTSKAMDDAFGHGNSPAERAIAAAAGQWNMAEIQILQQDIFVQHRRLVDAERALQVKPTKKAENEPGVAGRKIDRALAKLASLKRSQPEAGDSWIFPGYYAPVIVSEGGQLVIKPMRYQCRLTGKPASYDQRIPERTTPAATAWRASGPRPSAIPTP